MIIVVDVDDVTANTMNELVKKYNQAYQDWLTVADIRAWDVSQFVEKKCGDQGFWNLLTPVVYDKVEPMEGATAGIERLREVGHRILFATAAGKLHPGRKLTWLMEHSFIPEHPHWSDDYAEIKYKSLLYGDVIVDDNPENVQKFPGHAILFDRPWNHNFDWPNRAMSWDDVVRCVREWQECEEGGHPTIVQQKPLPSAEQIAALIAGVGPDVPMVVGDHGGRQSALPYSFDLVDPIVMFNLAQIVHQGAIDHGMWNWRLIPINEQLNHALAHIYAHLAGDEQDDHLGHALCRLMFAKSIEMNPDPKGLMAVKEAK